MRAAAGADLPLDDTRRAIAAALDLVRAGSLLLVVTDFDGTLSPIVSEPGDAAILPPARRALRTLARLAAAPQPAVAVVVMSGRSAADVAGRVRVGGIRYVGLHGMEEGTLARRVAAQHLVVHAMHPGHPPSGAAEPVRATELADRVAKRLGNPGWLTVEPKGAQVALHYRRAPDAEDARSAVLSALDAEEKRATGPRFLRMESRRVVELRPSGATGKGDALVRLVEELQPTAVLAMGDDVTDAGMFTVIRTWRDGGAHGARMPGLAIGVRGGMETPRAILDTADLLVDGPGAAAQVLASLAASLGRARMTAGVGR